MKTHGMTISKDPTPTRCSKRGYFLHFLFVLLIHYKTQNEDVEVSTPSTNRQPRKDHIHVKKSEKEDKNIYEVGSKTKLKKIKSTKKKRKANPGKT